MAYIQSMDKGENINRYTIVLDDESKLSVHKNVARFFKLREFSMVNMNNIKEQIYNQELTYAKEYVLYLLGQSARSRKQINDKMKYKGYSSDVIAETMEFLDKHTLINDKEYAINYINSKSKRYGKNKIKYDLRSKGIDNNTVDMALDESEQADEYETALEVGRQRFSSYKGDDKQKIYRKLGGYLQRRGFTMGTVKRVLNELLK